LGDFLSQQDNDIALLQEVTNSNLTCIRNYTVHGNIGTEGRGTAFLSKTGISITDVTRIPSGRGIAANPFGKRIVNIYAPSGAEKKAEREHFFSNMTIPLMPTKHSDLLLAGNFNGILNPSDSTGNGSFSRSLEIVVRDMELNDAWEKLDSDNGYTH
jgi:exonuclease III